MLQQIKTALHFTVARYFRFFARIRLRRWDPHVVLITGSNGKTVCLHLTEAQLGASAKYSHHANSAFGIPFDILGLHRSSFSPVEWIWLAFAAPFAAWKKPYDEKIYVVEVDGDRPGEGDFLGSLLRPEVSVCLSVARTHSMLFEKTVHDGPFRSIDEAIAYEFGGFIEHTTRLAIVNADSPLIMRQLHRTHAKVYEMREKELLVSHTVSTSGSEFNIGGTVYRTPFLLPQETFYAIVASMKIADYFGVQPGDLSRLTMPPGRSSLFRGIKNATLVDSSYNANVDSVAAIVRMAEKLPGEKWLVLGDLTEQGGFEKEEHERLAEILCAADLTRIIMVGPRMRAYTKPALEAAGRDGIVESFIGPREALTYLVSEIRGGEILVFKGARFLEGIIEHLLRDEADVEKLCRREEVWQKRRKNFGL
ncbi:hypothetical protein HY971_04280 [Candidatus Kaiserbacteria bacterium]|nr:hypothetical protein [Candidatus Kaiserbacteria bacterium]